MGHFKFLNLNVLSVSRRYFVTSIQSFLVLSSFYGSSCLGYFHSYSYKECVTRIVTHFWRFFHTRLNGFLRETEKRWKSFLFGAIKTGLNFLHRAQISRTRGINVWTRKIFFPWFTLRFLSGGSLKSGKWRQNRQWFRKKIRESKFFCFLPLLLIGKVS